MNNPGPIPTDEQARLAALSRYEILDTPPEPDFDGIVELAAYICGTPIAAISLVDADRQWFKASVGVAISGSSRQASFCQHAILQDSVMVVPDATLDDRVRSSPFVTGPPYVRFYAGAPLRSSDGYLVGVLCVKDVIPRALSGEQCLALQHLARQVVAQLEVRKETRERIRQAVLLEAKLREADDSRISLAEAEQRLGQIAANVPGLAYQFVTTDEDTWEFTYLSPGVCDVLGVESEAFLRGRMKLSDFVHPEDIRSFSSSCKRARAESQPWSWHGRIVDAHGSIRWIEGKSKPQRLASGTLAWNGVLIDVTSRRVQDELNAAKDEAERSNQSKSEFLSRMSHELRTPLNAILGFAQLMKLRSTDENDQNSLDQILGGGRHLLSLINEVLDISRIETGSDRISTEMLDIRAVAAETIDMLRPQARLAQVSLELCSKPGTLTYVLADPRRLKQILLNLLSNAVKYNRPNGKVALKIEPGGCGVVRIHVTDTGLGIALDHVHRIFTPFDRLGADALNIEGTGLGLTLSKRLAEAMDGSLVLAENGPEGCTFTLELKCGVERDSATLEALTRQSM